MKKIIYLFFVLLPLFGVSQNRNSIWCFGDSAGINFNNLINPIPIISGMNGRGSCSSIADSNGNLMFYAYTYMSLLRTTILNSLHDTLSNSNPMPGDGLYNELTIIPKPGSNNLYYLFYTGVRGFVDTTYYALIDTSLNGGVGGAVFINKPLDVYRPGDCLTAAKHGNGRDWWIVGKLSSTSSSSTHNRFFVYLVTPDSIYQPIVQDFNDARDADFQKIIWHPSYNKLMLINIGGYMTEFNFDRCTGNITLNQNIFPQQLGNYNRLFWEGAYSPNGDVFYFSTDDFPGIPVMHLMQLDLTSANIPASIDTLDTYQGVVGTGAVRLAPDGKIYFARAYQVGFPYSDTARNYINENLSIINSPDSLGSACNYQPFSFYLGGKRTYYGLPNNPNYDLGALQGSVCDSLTVSVNSPSVTNSNSVLNIFYHPEWDIAFINAQKLKGKSYALNVYDLLGNLIFKEEGNVSTSLNMTNGGYYTKDLNMQAFATGLYVVSLTTEKERLVKKFVRE